MSSTELFEAASISITSSEVALAIETHESHSPHGLDRRPVLAVQAGGEDLRHARLAGPARAHEQVGVVDLALLDGVAERAHDVLLADDVGERAGAVAAVERGAGGHEKSSLVRAGDRMGGPAAPDVRRRSAAGGYVAPGRRAQRGPRKVDRAPPVEAGTRGAAAVSRLRFGAPAAPGGDRLRLLPSGPDLVHGSSSPTGPNHQHREQGADPGACAPREGIQPR